MARPAPAPTPASAPAPASAPELTAAERRGFLLAVETAELFAAQIDAGAHHLSPGSSSVIRLRARAYAELASLLRGAV